MCLDNECAGQRQSSCLNMRTPAWAGDWANGGLSRYREVQCRPLLAGPKSAEIPQNKGTVLKACMDETIIQDHLALAERHVAQGRGHVVRQKQIIIDLRNGGHDTTMAETLLAEFEQTLRMHIADRDRLKRELADNR